MDMKRLLSLFCIFLACVSGSASGQPYDGEPVFLTNGLVKDWYIIQFQPRREGETPVVWPPNPQVRPPFGMHSSGQTYADIEAALNLNGDVLNILDGLNMVVVRMGAREADRIRADPRVLRVEEERYACAASGGSIGSICEPQPAPLYTAEALPFRNGSELLRTSRFTLTLPSVDYGGIPALYQDATIEFLPNSGTWRLFDYRKAIPVQSIDEVNLILTTGLPQQALLEIHGHLNNGCLEIGEAGMNQIEKRYTVYLYYKPIPRECLGTEDVRPFRKVVPLPIYGLRAGTYSWNVNGKLEGSFTLNADNEIE